MQTVTPILRLGAVDYLPKPFDPTQLINSVANALSRHQLEQENASMHREVDENARLYKFLLNASSDLIYMLDPTGNFQFVNQQLDGVFDVKLDELVGKPWDALFEKQPGLIDVLGHKVNERRTGIRATIADEFEFSSDLGTRHNLEISSIGLYDHEREENDYLGTYGIIRDVTESKRTRRQLQQSQQKFYSLFVDCPDAVFITKIATGEIIERNPKFVEVRTEMGAADDGMDHFLWTEDQPRNEFVQGLARNPNHFDWLIETEVDKTERYFEVNARQLELEGEQCMIATVRDRTLERRAEQDRLTIQQQLQQAGRMEAIGQVAGGIAHDFNNILASIIGYTELVMNTRKRFSDEQINQYLDEVVTAGHRARDLISQMLTFTRAQRGETAAIDVTQTIADVSRMLRAAIPSTIELDTQFDDDLPAVNIDAIQLQQVIINLLINARDAIHGNGRIEVFAKRTISTSTCRVCGEEISGEQVAISVRDNGHGILPEIIDKIFEMYFTTRETDAGTGFGLWMINNLLHEHDGHITVESELEVGTTFTIHLPANDHETVVSDIAPIPVPKIEGRIVVVDDEVSVANFIAEVLRDKGYPTVVFTDSPQAMTYLQNNMEQIALLVTDGAMPLITGVELAEFAKSRSPDLPIIFITAYTKTHSAQALKKIGVDHYLQKPFSIEEMLTAVGSLVLQSAPAQLSSQSAEG
ncbi:MAG: response regulator [Pseudomonadales bacterium]|nr:response regulator [Pseudomonadales bacterium]